MDMIHRLPDELIIKICDNLDTPDLIRLTEGSSKVYQVSQDMISDRKLENEGMKRITDDIKDGRLFIPRSDYGSYFSVAKIIHMFSNTTIYSLRQVNIDRGNTRWPSSLDYIQHNINNIIIREYKGCLTDSDIQELANNLYLYY